MYSNDPTVNQRGASAASDNSSNKSQSVLDRALGAKSDNDKNVTEPGEIGNNKVMYEESILMTLLGPDYMQFISEETGEWVNESLVVEKFTELFETRIRCIFDAQ